MLAQICQFLAVDSSNFPLNEHVTIGDRSCQGGFLIHYFLNLCQKQNRPVLFVGLSQSFSHYNTVAHKLGNNLVSARDNKSLIFVDGLQLLSECLSPVSCQNTENNPFFHLLRGNSANVFELIRSSFDILRSETWQPVQPVVIIDGLSNLLSVGVTTHDLLILVNSLHGLVTSEGTKGSIVILTHLVQGDKEAEELWSFLSHLSTLKVEVSDLQSGYCKDVHGQMHIQWRDSHLKPRKAASRHTQFKLGDTSCDLFAPGMSAAVL